MNRREPGNKHSSFEYISQQADLTTLCKKLEGTPWLAVDTEFEREKTFYPELCLLQVANSELAAVIDPLAIKDLSPLKNLLYDDEVTKVFHAARQDLEIFYFLWDGLPANLFDTQVAAPLLGFDEQPGYAKLVQGMLGVKLDKAHTRTNWKKRPLAEAQLQYAADDVIYLARLYPMMREKLENKGRLDWLASDFAMLANVALYELDPGLYSRKIKGASKLNAEKSALLLELIGWRENIARKENRPRNWVMRDEALLDLARIKPADNSELESMKGPGVNTIKKYAREILDICNRPLEFSAAGKDRKQAKTPLKRNQKLLFEALSLIVKLLAEKNELHPNLLAPAKELEKFVRNDPASALLKGWRKEILGDELRSFAEGESSLQVYSGKPELKRIKS